MLARLRREVAEGFVLSTCNRTELYAITGHADTGARVLAGFLARCHSIPAGDLEPHAYTHAHEAAARHLFRVTSGLDSMVLGEDQIVAQVKSALHAAQDAGTLGSRLHRLGAAALGASKRVRSETALGRSAVSVMSVGLELAREQLGSLERCRIVVAGAGRTADAVIRLCRSFGPAASITIVNRTTARAEALAERHGALAAGWDTLGEHLRRADLLVTAVSAGRPVIRTEGVAPRLAGESRLVVLDLSVPRAVDPAAARSPGVTLLDVDALQHRAAANRKRRAAEVAAAESIIDRCVAEFSDWWRAREVAPAISRLRAHAEALRAAELQRALAKLPGLSPGEQTVVRDLATRLVGKLLHHPTTNLRHLPDAATLASALDRLFTPHD